MLPCIETKLKTVGERSWAACIRRIFEAYPLTCQGCGSELKLMAVITADSEVSKILSYLNQSIEWPTMTPARPPPDTPAEEGQINPDTYRWDGIQDAPREDNLA